MFCLNAETFTKNLKKFCYYFSVKNMQVYPENIHSSKTKFDSLSLATAPPKPINYIKLIKPEKEERGNRTLN